MPAVLMASRLTDIRRSRDFRSGAFASFLASGRRARIASFDNPWNASGELPATFVCVAAQIIVNCLQDFYRVVRVLHDRRQMEQQIETLPRGLGL
jgi:hypothetical protein